MFQDKINVVSLKYLNDKLCKFIISILTIKCIFLGLQGNVGERGKDGKPGPFGPSGIKGNIIFVWNL